MSSPKKEDFYDLQRRQWRRSLLATAALFLFYLALLGSAILVVLAGLELVRSPGRSLSTHVLLKSLAGAASLALVLVVFHFLDARKNGARFILRRLGGLPPDPHDRYHRSLQDVVEEIGIAAGLPRVKCYVLPAQAVNCLALVESDGTPAVAVTEGLLSEATRDELQAAVAHETAHLVRGDTFFITLVCCLADVFERLRQSLEPEGDAGSAGSTASGTGAGGSFLLAVAGGFSVAVLRLLSTLISRQREVLADAAAVELCRTPEALARILYKARLKNSFVGDFSLTYSPLFIVSSDPLSEDEGLRGRLFSTHPPLMDRVDRLARLAGTTGAAIVQSVWDIQKNRSDHRRLLLSEEEYLRAARAEKVWLVSDDRGRWLGPFGLDELFRNPYFTLAARVRNGQEGIEAEAREFPVLREEARRRYSKKSPPGPGRNLCPKCREPLGDYFYEGVPVQICRRCLGKLVAAPFMDRILARREFSFSPELVHKAREFKEQFLTNPLRAQRVKDRESPPIYCPSCGYRMASRPYNYQYFLPVEKCLSCYKIWFDADELEILQILVEKG
jgi:Zn-dependent protease with chaperone function/Zn-finger nucleic acid-binding protein